MASQRAPFQPGQYVRLAEAPGSHRGVVWGQPRNDGSVFVAWEAGELRDYYRPEQLRGDWTPTELDQFRRDAIAVACPLASCEAPAGEPCTYQLARRDDETGRFLGWSTVARAPHLPRVAVFTDGKLYGYTVRHPALARAHRPGS